MLKMTIKMRKPISQLSQDVRAGLSRAVRETAAAIEADAKTAIQTGPKSGQVYRRGGTEHQASAPGEAPATDLGVLAASVESGAVSELKSAVSVGAEYAAGLEFGTVQVAPRPFMTPAIEGQRDEFHKRIQREVGKELA